VGLKILGNTNGKKKITSPEIIRLRRVRNLAVGFKGVGFIFSYYRRYLSSRKVQCIFLTYPESAKLVFSNTMNLPVMA